MARKPTKQKTKIYPTEDGLHLGDSILWLDSKLNGDLSFLSSAESVHHSKVPQVIATEETVKILESKRQDVNALVCQYNRPFSIGRLKMELLPSGTMLGGASLYVETEKDRILYAPHIQTQKILTVRKMQLKKANTLVLGATQAEPKAGFPNRNKEKDRLLTAVASHIEAGRYPVIYCDMNAAAQELIRLLSDEGIQLAVHPKIYRICRIYEQFGSNVGEYSLYSKRNIKNRILIMPLSTKIKNTTSKQTEMPALTVYTGKDEIKPNDLESSDNIFKLSYQCDYKDLKEVIDAVSPKEVYVFGPYAKKYVDELSSIGPKVKPLYVNDQPTLF